MRGGGKTIVGRLLAERLRCSFVDLDEWTAAGFSESSVAEIWRVHGERAWRDAESRALARALQPPERIVALGGGTPLIPEAAEMLVRARDEASAVIVYLHATAQVLAQRLAAKPGDRPSLTGADVVEELSPVLAKREPAYRSLANLEIDTGPLDPSAVAAAVLKGHELL